MTITPFGLIFVTLGLTLLVARPAWLLPLLIVSSVLHAFAVATIGTVTVTPRPESPTIGLGVSPWLFTSSLIFVHSLAIMCRHRRIDLGVSHPAKLLFWGWIIFIAWCVLSAFTLPFIFEGTPLHPLSNWYGFDGPLEPLVWNRISAIHATNSIIIGMLLVYVLQLAEHADIAKRLMSGFIAAILISIGISICQSLQLSGAATVPFNILHQSLNPSYSSGFDPARVHWPFSEPSYAGVWYSSVSLGGLAIYLFTNRAWAGISLFIAGLCALLNSRGGTGFAGFALAIPLLVTALAVILSRGKIPLKLMLWRLTLVAVFVCLIAISYETARQSQPKLPDIYSSIGSIFEERVSGPISFRGQSNLDAVTIIKNTWGLGSGLGTNRASSYLLSMMSNVGIPGLVLFLILLTYQSYLIVISSTTSAMLKAFIVGGTIGMFSGMIMGIPDLMFPAWWIWLIAGFGFIASGQHARPVQSA